MMAKKKTLVKRCVQSKVRLIRSIETVVVVEICKAGGKL